MRLCGRRYPLRPAELLAPPYDLRDALENRIEGACRASSERECRMGDQLSAR